MYSTTGTDQCTLLPVQTNVLTACTDLYVTACTDHYTEVPVRTNAHYCMYRTMYSNACTDQCTLLPVHTTTLYCLYILLYYTACTDPCQTILTVQYRGPAGLLEEPAAGLKEATKL